MKGGFLPRGLAGKQRGYTIVEVMIVLAVSGVMFLIAANFVGGKQARTAYNVGVNTLASDMQSKIDSVSNGQFTDVPTGCRITTDTLSKSPVASPNRTITLDDPSLSLQGENNACVFMGYMFHFTIPNTAPIFAADVGKTISPNQYATIPLGGARVTSTNEPITDLRQSALSPLVADNQDLSKRAVIPQGLEVEGMKITFKSGLVKTDVYNLEIILSIPLASGVPGLYATGGQTLTMLSDPTITTDTNKVRAEYVALEKYAQYVSKAMVCVTDGTRHGTVTIGENGNQIKARATLGLSANTCV